MLSASHVTVQREGRRLLDGVSMTARPGEVHVILGPNGAGKSTLLRVLAGDLEIDSGTVELDARALQTWPLQQLARRRAVLLQQDSLRFAFTAAEVVALGRLPFERGNGITEQSIVSSALQATGSAHLAERRYTSLSGGERARVQLARVLAQLWPNPTNAACGYLLLDEPTASLDLAHQHECLRQMQRFAAGGGAVIAVLHDPNQTLAVADQVSLLQGGHIIAAGTPTEIMTPARLSTLYGLPLQTHVTLEGHRIIGVAGEPRQSR